MNFGYLIVVLIICLAALGIIIYFCYYKFIVNNNATVSFTFDFEENRVKLLASEVNKKNKTRIFHNKNLTRGYWISFEDFSKSFVTESARLCVNSLANFLDNNKNIDIVLNLKNVTDKEKYQCRLMIEKLATKSKTVGVIAWKKVSKSHKTNIFFLRKPFEFMEMNKSLNFVVLLGEHQYSQRANVLNSIYKRLAKFHNINYVFHRQYNAIVLSVVPKSQVVSKKVHKYFVAKMQDLVNQKKCQTVIFVDAHFDCSLLSGQILLDYLTLLGAKHDNFYQVKVQDFDENVIYEFTSAYKKTQALVEKKLIIEDQHLVIDTQNQIVAMKIDSELQSLDNYSSLILNTSSLKTNYYNNIFPLDEDNFDKVKFVSFKDSEYVFLRDSTIPLIEPTKQKLICFLESEELSEQVIKRMNEFKQRNIETYWGFVEINTTFYSMISNYPTEYVFISKKMTNMFNDNNIFLKFMSFLEYAKKRNIKVVIEDFNKDKFLAKILKVNKDVLLTERITND
ncbi:hypothetical protein ACWXVL_00460 [Mycoplasma sp. 128]